MLPTTNQMVVSKAMMEAFQPNMIEGPNENPGKPTPV
jgi:hypothetical protein|tara:strand:+ start:348 stop:458 length:111 start_codon:yes stop_codon:yes gene_type:complete